MAGIYDTINQQINQRRKSAGLVTAEYANPYELIYQQSKSNPFFTEQDWDKFKRRGELDGYLGILQSANETLDYDTVSNDYGFKWIDDDTRFNAIWNELNKNNLQETSMRYEERYNYDTEQYDKIEIGEMSDYEYNKLIIDQIKTAEVDKFKHQMAEDIKNNRSGFGKFMGTALSTLILGPLSGATEAVDNMTTVFAGLGSGVESVLNGGRFDEGFSSAYGETNAYGDVLKGADGQIFQGLRDAIMDFESQYSWMRDLDGQYTNYGKIAGGVGTSLGKILPSMAMNFVGGKFVEAGGKGATILGKASEALYYTSLGSGTFKDLVNDPSLVSVPTYQLMLNAAAKTATEWAVQKALSKAFGTTALDQMTFGQKGGKTFGGTSFAKVSKKVLLDAAHEGLEELTQDYSSYIWDRAFGVALNDKFGQMAEWNMQTAIDAFVLGALSVVASSAFSIAKAPRVSRGPQIDAEGNIVTDKKGRVKQDFVGKFTSWIYRADMASMTENFNEALKNDKLTTEQRQDVVGQMYAAMRTITSIYGDIGEQRFAEAEALLKEMQAAAAKLELTDEQIKANATAIYESVATIGKAYTQAQIDKVVNAIIDKGMTKAIATNERGQDIVMDMPQEIQDAVVKTITDLYKADPKINKFVITEDGTGPVFDDFSGTVFAPIKYLVNTDGRMVLEHVAEQQLVETIETTKDKRIQGVLTELKRIFEQSTNRTDVDMSEVIYNTMFNDSFYRIALSTANAQMYQFLSHLNVIEKEATANTEKNAVYKKKIKAAKKNIGVALTQWLILQQNANYSDLTVLTKEQRAFIQKHRYGKDLANRVINGDSLSQADVDLLRARINSMPASPEVKLDIMTQLGFTAEWNRTTSTPLSRSLGIHALNQTYADFFVTPFNGQKYMQSTSLQNNLFNDWLMTNDLDLETLVALRGGALNNAKEMFRDRTGGAYEFLIVKGKIALKPTRFQNIASYKDYQKIREQIKSGRPRMQVIERTLTTVRDGRGYLNGLIGNKVDAASKGFMTLTDVITDPSVLKENLKQKILDYYGRINSYTALLYLRDYTLEQTGTTSIVARDDGTFTYADITGMLDMLKDKSVTPSQIGEVEKGNIKRLVKLEFLPEGSRLADVTVKQEGSESGYDADTNTITIAKTFPKSITDVDAYFRFALMHEFQHAVQAENNLNGGLNSSWLYRQDTSGKLHFSMPADQAQKLISEVRHHRPDLFKDAEVINDKGQRRTYPTVRPGTEIEARIVQQFIYDTSGESQAMGTEGDDYIVDFYPTIVQHRDTVTTLTLPWGTQYQLGGVFQGLEIPKTASNNPLLTDTWDGNYDSMETHFDEAMETVYDIVYDGLKDLYGDRVYFENDDYGTVSPRVRAERRGDKAVLYHGSRDANFNIEKYRRHKLSSEIKQIKMMIEAGEVGTFHGDALFVSTVPEYSLGYGPFLYEMLMPWTEYETLSNAQVDADFQEGLDGEIGRATEHAVQRVIDNQTNSEPEIKKLDRNKYDDTELNRLALAGQEGNQSFVFNPRSQSLEPPKQPGPERTRVTKTKISEHPRLKPFKGKLLSNDWQTLIVEADFAQLDPRVKTMIDDGTLNTQRTNNILRDTTKKINDYTFKLLNQYIYKNKYIKSITQLDKLTQLEASDYWAIREILRKRGALELLIEPRTYTEFMDMLRTLEKNDALRRAFATQRKVFENKVDKHGNVIGALDINRGNMRVAFIKSFDGTIDKAGAIADIARKAAIAGVGSTTDVQKTRGGLEQVSSVVAAENADVMNSILAAESVYEKELRITKYKMERWAEVNPKATHKDMLRQMNKVKGELEALLDKTIDEGTDYESILDFYIADMFITEVFDVKGEDIEIVADVPVYTRTIDSIRGNLLRHARGFRDNISNKEFAKLDKDIQDMFDKNRRLKRDYYDTRTYLEDDGKTIKRVGKTREQVLELEEMMKVLHKQARDGDFKNKTQAEMARQLERAKDQLAKEKGRRILAEGKRKVEVRERTIVLNDKEFDITSDIDIPASLKDILDTTFDEFSKAETTHLTGASELKNAITNYVNQKQLGLDTSDIDVLVNALINTTVQGRGVITEDTFKETIRNNRNNARFAVLTDHDATNIFNLYNEGIQERIKSGDRNMKMNLRKFFEANAQRLQGLSQSEIDLIVEFYEKANLTGRNISRDDIRKFDAFQIYMLSYILGQSRQNVWKLTAAQIKAIENKLELMASMAGTNLSVWRAAIDIVDPNKTILQSIERSSGVELRESDIDAISKAMQKGDIKAVQDAQAEMLRHALEDNAGRKRSVWNKLWAFQRMAMLSGPGTWIRNHVSNALVTVGNDTAASLGNLFAKKHRKQGQYIIAGTKVDTNTKNFINTNIIDNGFLDSVMDGLSKYDTRHTRSRTTGTDVAIDMLARAVESQVLNHAPLSKNKKADQALRAIPNFIMKMLSDDPFIKMRTKSYLGKMLVEDKTNLTQGLSHEVLTTLSEAYTAACFDYMRKPNAFSKMEAKLKESGGDAAYFAYKQIFPFMSASWNWFAEGLRYTPLGLAKAILDFARLENTIDKMERQRLKGEHVMSSRFAEYLARRNIGKGIIGSIGMGIGLLLGAIGVAEIEDDDDKIKLRVGDYRIDISGVFGSQSIMIGMALTNPRKAEEYNFIAHMTDVLDTLADDSIMSDMYNAFRFNDSTGEWLLDQPNRTLGMFVPNFLKTVTSLTYNHQIQYSKGFIGRVERTIAQGLPGIAHAFPKRTDPYTGEVMSRFKLPFLIDFMNRMLPVKLSDNYMSKAEENALAVGVRKGELTGRYDDIAHFNAKQKSALNAKYGELNKSTFADLETSRTKYRVEMPDGKYKDLTYSQMDDIQKKRVIDRLMVDNARYAKVFVYTNSGGKYVASSSDYKILKKLGITKNVVEENKRKNLVVGFS